MIARALSHARERTVVEGDIQERPEDGPHEQERQPLYGQLGESLDEREECHRDSILEQKIPIVLWWPRSSASQPSEGMQGAREVSGLTAVEAHVSRDPADLYYDRS